MPNDCVGRHGLLVKQDQIPQALARAGQLNNKRPSSSGKGRRVSTQRKKRLGLIKDPPATKEAASLGETLLGGGAGLLGGYGAGKLVDYLRGAESSSLPWATALLGGAAGGYAGYKGLPSRLFSPKSAPSAAVGEGGDGAGTGSAGPESSSPFNIQAATPEELEQWMYEPGGAGGVVDRAEGTAATASNALYGGMLAKGLGEGGQWLGSKVAPGATRSLVDKLTALGVRGQGLLSKVPLLGRLAPAGGAMSKIAPPAVYGALALADPARQTVGGMTRVSRAKQVGQELLRRGLIDSDQAQKMVKDMAMLDTSALPGFDGEFSPDLNARTDPRAQLTQYQQLWREETGKAFEQALDTFERTGSMPESVRLADGTVVPLPGDEQQFIQVAQQQMGRADSDPALQTKLYEKAKERAGSEQNTNLLGDFFTAIMPQTMIGLNTTKDVGHFGGDVAHAIQTGDVDTLVERNRQKGQGLRQQVENDMEAARRARPSDFWDNRNLNPLSWATGLFGAAAPTEVGGVDLRISPREAWLGVRAGLKNPLYIHTALDDSLNELRKARDEAADSEHMAKIKALQAVPAQQRDIRAGTQKPESVHYLTKQKDPDWYNRVDWDNNKAYPGGKEQFLQETFELPEGAQARMLFGLEPEDMSTGDWLRLNTLKEKYKAPKLTRAQSQALSGLPEDVQRGIARRLVR